MVHKLDFLGAIFTCIILKSFKDPSICRQLVALRLARDVLCLKPRSLSDWKRFWQRILKLAQIWSLSTFSSCEVILLRFHPCGSPKEFFFFYCHCEFLYFFSCHVDKNNALLIKIFYYTFLTCQLRFQFLCYGKV